MRTFLLGISLVYLHLKLIFLKKNFSLCCDRGATSGSHPSLCRPHPWWGRSRGSEEWTADRWWSHQGPSPHVEVQQDHAPAERTPPHNTELIGGDCWPGMHKMKKGPPHLIFFNWVSLSLKMTLHSFDIFIKMCITNLPWGDCWSGKH